MAQDYTVTAQRHTTIINDAGQLQQVMEVTFQTTGGVTAHVDVPLSQYTAQNVQQAIEAYVKNINAVGNL